MRVPEVGRVFDRPRGSGRNSAIAYYLDGEQHRESVAAITGRPPDTISEREAVQPSSGGVSRGAADPRARRSGSPTSSKDTT